MTMQRDPTSDATLARILARAAERVRGINETTRDKIRDSIAAGVAEGEGAAALGARISSSAALSEYRGELIARTETMFAWNASSIETYRDVGVTMVEPQDGDADPMCAARMLRGAVPLDEALDDEDHPNGTLSWTPVFAPGDIAQLRQDVREAGLAGEAVSAEELDAAVSRLVDSAKAAEPQTTRDIVEIGRARGLNPNETLTLDNGKTVRTLDFVTKTEESTFRKVVGELEANPAASLDDVTGAMRDNLRYTYVSEPGNYNAAIRAATDDLIARGYQPVKVTNYWSNDGGYAAVNSNWRTPNGQIFELQFNTQQGLRVKELKSHPLYEAQRKLPEGSPEWNGYQRQIDTVWRDYRADNPGLGRLDWLRDVFPEVRG